MGPPQLEWSEDEGPHEVVEVKTKENNETSQTHIRREKWQQIKYGLDSA